MDVEISLKSDDNHCAVRVIDIASRYLRLELMFLFAVFFFLLSPSRIAIKLPAGSSIFVFLINKVNKFSWVENCNFLSYIHQFSNQSSIKSCLKVVIVVVFNN